MRFGWEKLKRPAHSDASEQFRAKKVLRLRKTWQLELLVVVLHYMVSNNLFEEVQHQVDSLMTTLESLLITIIGAFLVAISLTTFAVSSLRGWSRDRAAPLFGVVALLYGVRLLVRSTLVWEATGLTGTWFRFADDWITYAILAPATMFVEVIAPPAYRTIARRLWQIDLIYAALAIGTDIAVRRHGSVLWINPIAVILHFSLGAALLIGSFRMRRHERSPRQAPPARGGMITVMIGASIFAVLAAYETIFRRSPLHSVNYLEPVGMLAFIAGLGYFVAQRVIESERRFISISKELETARNIQQSILPAATPSAPGLEIFASYLPMAEVAGDFYDFLDQGDGRLGVLVADVSGHGVPAALIASMVKIAFAAQADHASDPARVIAGMNHALCGKFEFAYVTATYAFLDPARRVLAYASAGHPPILLLRASGEIESLEEGGIVLAFTPDASYSNVSIPLDPGDRMLLYTDGLLETADQRGTLFGDARLFESLRDAASLNLPASLTHLISDLNSWRGPNAPLTDDVTLVTVELRADTLSTLDGRRYPSRPSSSHSITSEQFRTKK
jgi:phosphoserine phosphatase RsbU/P